MKEVRVDEDSGGSAGRKPVRILSLGVFVKFT